MLNLNDDIIGIIVQYCMFTPHQILFFFLWKKYMFSDLFFFSKYICESIRNLNYFNKIINGVNKHFKLTFENMGFILFVSFNFLKKRSKMITLSEHHVNKCLKNYKDNLSTFLKRKILLIQSCSYVKHSEQKKEAPVYFTFVNNSVNKNNQLVYFNKSDVIIRCFFCKILCKTNDSFNCCIRCKYIHFYDITDPQILSQLTFFPIYK